MWSNLLSKIVAYIDPKFEKYRKKKEEKKYTPESLVEFVNLIKRMPKKILSEKDRSRIAAIMSFDDRKVKDLMIDRKEMVFVNEKEFLGPLVLDKLYKSGFTNFPVVNDRDKVVGIIHTEALNTLEIKKADKAIKYADKKVSYLHENDSLAFAITEIERTNGYYFLVLNQSGEMVGFFTVQMLLDYFTQ